MYKFYDDEIIDIENDDDYDKYDDNYSAYLKEQERLIKETDYNDPMFDDLKYLDDMIDRYYSDDTY